MVVVEVLAGIVENGLVLAVARLDDLLEAHALEAGAGQQLVEHVDIGLMVFVVVIFQRFRRHIGLQGVVRIGELHQVEGHGDSPRSAWEGFEKVAGKLEVPPFSRKRGREGREAKKKRGSHSASALSVQQEEVVGRAP
jgi:hypothetical protein